MGEREVELVRAVYASHEVRDTRGLLDLLADDVEWAQAEGHPYAGDGPWHGHDEVTNNVVTPINHDWAGFITRVDEIIDAGDRVVVTGHYTGTYKRTGRAIDAAVCVIYTLRDDKIVRFQQFCDTAQIRRDGHGAAVTDSPSVRLLRRAASWWPLIALRTRRGSGVRSAVPPRRPVRTVSG
jgi:ketosteroid isomerase-like protein